MSSLVPGIKGWGNGDIPPGRDWAALWVAAIMLFFAWTAVALRLYTRLFLVLAFGLDDIFMLLSLASFTVYAGCIINITTIDTLLDHMPWPHLQSSLKSLLLALDFYLVSITFLKLSLGIFLLRIVNKQVHKRIIYAVMIISTFWGFLTMMISTFQCGYNKNIDEYIMKRVKGVCISPAVALFAAYSHAVVSTASDVVFTTLPIFILRDAQINKRAKIVLSVILMMGGLGSIASFARFPYLKNLGVITTRILLKNCILSIWSSLEIGLGITAGSLATLRPMFRKLLQGVKTVARRTREQISDSYSKQSNTGNGQSRPRSFAQRLTRGSRRDTLAIKHPGDSSDVEACNPPPVALESVSEKHDTSTNRVSVSSVAFSEGQGISQIPNSPRNVAMHEWQGDARMSKDGALETVNEAREPPTYIPRGMSVRSSESSMFDQSHTTNWI